MTPSIRIIQPDDWHVHLRDDNHLPLTVAHTALHFSRALVMPNLMPPLTSIDAILAYEQRIKKHLPTQSQFTPYFTFYLNNKIKPETMASIDKYPQILGAKLYPQGVTTHSEQGVKNIESLYELFDIMQSRELYLQIHGEAITGDIFDREVRFLDESLPKIIKNFPRLNIILEHISTAKAVSFIEHAPDNVAATITPHHLMYERNDLLAGGIKPHLYCLPILKRHSDKMALIKAATSGSHKFFAGTDSAPHVVSKKQSPCGCAGIYSSPFAIALYTECFEAAGKLPKLGAFLSEFGAQFYRLPLNKKTIKLIKTPQKVPSHYAMQNECIKPIAAGESLNWSIDTND